MKFKKNTVIEISPKNFNNRGKITHPAIKDKKAMVAFMAQWCPHCVRFAPIYQKVASTLGSSFPLLYLDGEKYADFISKNLNIPGFPTIAYIDRDGKMYKIYDEDRDELSLMQNICKEAKQCKR